MRVGSQKTNAPGRGLEKGDVEFINGNGVSNTLAWREWEHLPKAEGEASLASLLAYHSVFGEPDGIRTHDPLIKRCRYLLRTRPLGTARGLYFP